ncbi:MAG TPA: 5'-nucleotidase C-terminal domain-containing protein, partial [Deinococcales bacterium]|nr:5'-nucleotidase C-terminal domain-containing protein [Deinococcales bacterium]
IVSANLDASADPLLKGLIKPSTVIQVRDQKIGIVGATTPDTVTLATVGDFVKFKDTVPAIQAAINDLKAQGINKIVLLSHLGYDVDQKVAAQLHDLDVIIGGHSHTPLGTYTGIGLPTPQGPDPTVVNNADGTPVLITQAWEYGKFYGDLRVTFDTNGVPVSWNSKSIPVTDAIAPNPAVANAIKAFAVPLEACRKPIVGTAQGLLNGDRTQVRQRETNLGDFVADAYLWKTKENGSVISLQNGGGIRASIQPGQVNIGQLISVQPFGNTVFLLDMTGAEVKGALENGVSQWEAGAGRFLQVAGIKYTFDLSKPVGSRVTDVQVGNAKDGYKPIDPNATYRVVTNNYMAAGGDGFDVLKNAKGYRYDTSIPDYVTFSDYFAYVKDANPQVEGRITILNEPKK